jgi:hypothetical protein
MKALTGNRLADGEVIFWKHGGWVDRFHDAELWADDAGEAADAAEAHAKSLLKEVVDPYLIDVEAVEGGFAPISYRERVRALGPTNKPDHGKQADHGVDVEIMSHAHGAARSTGRVNLIKRK